MTDRYERILAALDMMPTPGELEAFREALTELLRINENDAGSVVKAERCERPKGGVKGHRHCEGRTKDVREIMRLHEQRRQRTTAREGEQ